MLGNSHVPVWEKNILLISFRVSVCVNFGFFEKFLWESGENFYGQILPDSVWPYRKFVVF